MLGAGIALILLAGVILYFIGVKKMTQSYPNIPVETVNVHTDADAVARGKHIATIWSCTKCHGDDLGGALIDNSAFSGTIPAPNLTSGNGGIASSYANADWIRAIRHGIKPNGQVEILMYNYSTMSDQDLGDLFAYLKQLHPVDSNQPPMRLGVIHPIGSALGLEIPAAERIDHNAPHLASVASGATIENGKYLSAVCTECHKAKNIGTALRDWTQDDFIRAFHTGVLPNGKQLNRAMPLKTYGEMSIDELTALWLYFHSLRPIPTK
jgi:mono/diheme cytochrome c family protein